MRHLTVCDRVMREKGKVDLHLLLCVLNGPPRVGKSTFLNRLIGRLTGDFTSSLASLSTAQSHSTTSTGVLEKVVQITIKEATLTVAVAPKPGVNWKVVSLSEEAATLLRAILSNQSALSLPILQVSTVTPATTSPSLPPASSEASSIVSSKSTPFTALKSASSEIDPRFNVHALEATPNSTSSSIPGYVTPIEIFRAALRSKEWAESEQVQSVLGRSLNLYFNDTGGQPEFQEVLPVITAGPSAFFVVFKLPDSLTQKYRVQYVQSPAHKSITYESSFTVIESMLQSLASISSICSYVSHNSSELVPIRPKVVLVGTHKDQTSEEHIAMIQKELKEILWGTEYYKHGIVKFVTANEPALTINSLSGNEEDATNIRHFIENLARDPAFKISVPASWLALLLSLRVVETSVLSYEECLHIAKDCGVHGDELKEALWFLHTKLGIVRYFNEIPELQDIVILDPQIIFSKITDLITRTFTFQEIEDACISERFQKQGIFPASTVDEISRTSNDLLTCSKITALLKHLNIIAPIYDDQQVVTHYFMACVLSHTSKSPLPQHSTLRKPTDPCVGSAFSPCSSTMLCISFRCGYCPKGMFSAVVVDLMKLTSDKLKWRLKEDAIFRDQVSFNVGREYHLVTMTFHITHLDIAISATTQTARDKQQKACHEICNSIRLKVEQSLISVSRILHYGSAAGHFFGFYCPRCSGPVPANCDEEDPVVMSCRTCGPVDLDHQHRVWFGKQLVSCYNL